MKSIKSIFGIMILSIIFQSSLQATNYYVAASGSTPTQPWTNWTWAHTNLIEVANRARDNDVIYVSNGVYYLTNRVSLTYGITIRSWNANGEQDPTNTIINGYQPATLDGGCFYMTHTNAVVAGLTITNGLGNDGGGIYLSGGGIVSNCIIVGNVSTSQTGSTGGGGGIYISSSGRVLNCIISSNTTTLRLGGGIMMNGGSPLIQDCTIRGNSTGGGGALSTYLGEANIINCRIYGNTGAAGISLTYGGLIRNCIIMSNSVRGVSFYQGGNMYNSLLAYNGREGIYITDGVTNGALSPCTVVNCTVVSNGAAGTYPGIYYTSTRTNYAVYVSNTISFFNNGSAGQSNWYFQASASTCFFYNCCTAPTNGLIGAGNIDRDPQMVNRPGGNFRLSRSSPCINAGANMAWMIPAKDLDGNSRIDQFSGIVDIGAYEFLPGGAVIKFR